MSGPKRERARKNAIQSRNIMAVVRQQAAEKDLAKQAKKKHPQEVETPDGRTEKLSTT